jgi:hypothetical protein
MLSGQVYALAAWSLKTALLGLLSRRLMTSIAVLDIAEERNFPCPLLGIEG